MLETVLQLDPDPDRHPVTSDLTESLREAIAEGVNGGYDIDEVLFHRLCFVEGDVVEFRFQTTSGGKAAQK